MEEDKQISIKNWTYYFYNDIADARLLKIDKKSYKNIDIYYIGYIPIKKIDDCESIYSEFFCICVLIMQVYLLKKKKEINIWFLILLMQTKKYYKNIEMFRMELKTKLKQQMVVNKPIREKITWKLNLILTMTYH